MAGSFELAQILAILLALVLAGRNARNAVPFLFVAAITAFQSLLFETFGRSETWQRIMFATLDVPAWTIATASALIGLAALAIAWACGKALVNGKSRRGRAGARVVFSLYEAVRV